MQARLIKQNVKWKVLVLGGCVLQAFRFLFCKASSPGLLHGVCFLLPGWMSFMKRLANKSPGMRPVTTMKWQWFPEMMKPLSEAMIFFSPAIFLKDFCSSCSTTCARDLITYPHICHSLRFRGGGHVSADLRRLHISSYLTRTAAHWKFSTSVYAKHCRSYTVLILCFILFLCCA